MSCIAINGVQILDNPTSFTNPLQFEITFECFKEPKEDLEWKVIYVGSSESEDHDQVLDSVLLGPIKQGVNRFVFQVDPPDHERIPKNDLLGVTVLLLTCSYKDREFVRVGYYVNNEDPSIKPEVGADGEPIAPEIPLGPIDITKVQRNILADKPRITTFPIPWDDDESANISNAVSEHARSHDFPGNSNSSSGFLEDPSGAMEIA